ncbi:hypothetical protein T484DRAFT_1816404, partial [Baffinella frigidus]
LCAKGENFNGWYTEVLLKAELIEYFDVSGCYILRPWAFAMWEKAMLVEGSYFPIFVSERALNPQPPNFQTAMGVEGCYFPMFVSEKALLSEKDHIAGFSPEVA